EFDGNRWTWRLRIPHVEDVFSSDLVWDDSRQGVVIATTTGFSIYLSQWRQGAWVPFAQTPLRPAAPAGVSLLLASDPVRGLILVVAAGRTYVFNGVQFTRRRCACCRYRRRRSRSVSASACRRRRWCRGGTRRRRSSAMRRSACSALIE